MLRKMIDVKSYFSQASSGSRPSTHASGVCNEPEIQVGVQENNSEEVAHVLEENGRIPDANGENINGQVEGINRFNPDHIISDPRLRIPIDYFAPNIRDDVIRALIDKGPTQPIGHNFSQSHYKRSFQKHWFRQHSWLECSVEKNKDYCFYCYLFKLDQMDDIFCHDAFTKVGFSEWRNVYTTFPKHVGGPNSIPQSIFIQLILSMLL
jgi:hypothetical protein